jgi:predicted Zn-dependent peptidase
MLISVAGNFDVKKITKLVEKYFNLEPKKIKLPEFKEIKIKQEKSKLSIKFKETEQVQLCLGFPAYSYFHKNVYAQLVLAIILGGNMSSRLFINIRERKGLAYFVRSDINVYQDTGAFIVQAGLDKKRIEEAILAIWEELKKIKKEGVLGSELKKAKDFLEGKMVLELEDSENIAAYLAKQELLLNKIETPQEKIKKINKVSRQDIQRVAKNIIQNKKLTLALIGPFKEKKRFSDLIDKLK